MDFPNLGTNPELDDIMQRAKEFNIEDNLLDLVMYGFTVVPPEKMGASDLTPRLRDAILEVYERRSGHSIDNWKTYSGKLEKFQSWGWLLENDVFLEAIHNPVYQTIGQFLTGKSGFLAGASVILKTQDLKRDLPLLHSDSHGVPSPWPSFATYANLSWLLTDYLSREDGPTVLVPGSHRDRMPRGHESSAHVEDHDYIKPIPLEGPAGSLAVWKWRHVAWLDTSNETRHAHHPGQCLAASLYATRRTSKGNLARTTGTLAGFAQAAGLRTYLPLPGRKHP